ncbi:MAG: DUF1801 domain-containing protein [Halobacteriota archaeon]|nr:DUF1801 domain-containing protein [Halobacteriota archaeon]
MKENLGPSKIDEYIGAQLVEFQQVLREIRSAIKKAAPGSEETFNYNISAISLVKNGTRDSQIMFALYKKHIGFYPHPSTIEHFEKEQSEFKFAKGSVQFSLNEPIPLDQITKMMQYKLKEVIKENTDISV